MNSYAHRLLGRRFRGGARASGCGYPRSKQPFRSERELGAGSGQASWCHPLTGSQAHF